MIADMQEARDKIADALWWLRGFAAASEGGFSEDIAAKLTEVTQYLQMVQHGEVRRLGEETAVVMTYAEFEQLVDAIRVLRKQEFDLATQTIERVLADYRREDRRARDARNPDLPF